MTDEPLDPDVLARKATFLEAYGDLLRETESWSAHPHATWSAMSSTAAAATAYLEAVEHRLAIDEGNVREVAFKASELYFRLGMPLGPLLAAIFRLVEPFNSQAIEWLKVVGDEAPKDGHGDLPRRALRYPNQRLTLAVALLAEPGTGREFRGILRELLDRLGSQHPLTPAGPASVPLLRYVRVAETLAGFFAAELMDWKEEPDPGAWAEQFRDSVMAISRPHAASVQAASHNSYLWQRGLSPVTWVDPDLLGLAVGAFRAAGELRHADAIVSRLAPRAGEDFAELPLRIAQRLATDSRRGSIGAY